ncbi:hypothetical protein ACFWAR_14470 [Streptomyces sp. NPDC059917]|uniref:hypothetical protein n=1 Tax=Streptomyces sp. NPDC059917 TaxID=3347002 RepID=UPI003656D46F
MSGQWQGQWQPPHQWQPPRPGHHPQPFHPGWQPPPRPLPGAGTYLREASRILARTWRPLAGALLLAELAMTVVVVLGTVAVEELVPSLHLGRQSAELLTLTITASLVLSLVTSVPDALAATLSEQHSRGQRITVLRLLRDGAPRVIGSGGATAPPLLLMAFPPAAVWVWVMFTFVPAVKTYEGLGAIRAMGRSASLVRGVWGRVFAMRLLTLVLTYGLWTSGGLLLSLFGGLLGLDLKGDVTEGPTGVAFVVVAMAFGLGFVMFQSACAELAIVQMYKALRTRRPPATPAAYPRLR